jgi:hypothetical protein
MTGLMLIAVVFGFVIAVLWILMPFAIFGTKPLLERILAELTKLNEHLARQPKPKKSGPSRLNYPRS